MNYKTQPGVVLTTICGSRFLMPTRAASEHFPRVIRLSFLTAICWSIIYNGHGTAGVYEAMGILTKKPREDVEAMTDRILGELYDVGALVAAEECANESVK